MSLPMLPAPGMIFMALHALPTSPLVVTFYLFEKHTYQRDWKADAFPSTGDGLRLAAGLQDIPIACCLSWLSAL